MYVLYTEVQKAKIRYRLLYIQQVLLNDNPNYYYVYTTTTIIITSATKIEFTTVIYYDKNNDQYPVHIVNESNENMLQL